MKVLGVSAGAADGSAEILLKAALMEIEALGHDVSLLRLDDLAIPTGPFETDEPDDCPWFLEQVLASDGVIYSSPIYSRSIAGKLRLLTDRVFGPHTDTGFVEFLLGLRERGEPNPLPFEPDERVLRGRVAAFIAVGGSLTDQWKTLALPLMWTLTLSMREAVVDQVVFQGAGTPKSIVLDAAALQRARELGRNVASQLGRGFDDAEYLGDPGICPYCHLSVIAVRGDVVECATCGAEGRFEVVGGSVTVRFSAEGLDASVVTMAEKRAHVHEVFETAVAHAGRADEVAAGAAPFAEWDRRITPTRV